MATKNKRKPKGRPQFSKRQREVESMDMRKDSRVPSDSRDGTSCMDSKPNDWRWYAQNPQLLADYASLPFGDPVGNEFITNLGTLSSVSVPGVMVLNFYPTIGYAAGETAPINVAMRRLYSFVRHANSGASNYDAPDLMLYMVCVDSAIMFHSWMKRAYGVMLDYTPFNRYYPRTLIHAMGIDFEDLEKHLNDFRGYINQYAVKLSQLWVPNTMSYTARHAWMCDGIYTDGMSPKAQTYLYNPQGFYKFTLTDGVGSATMVDRNSTPMKFADIYSLGDSLLNPMLSNEDFGIMGGDILKAFGESGIIKILGITEDYKILPVYSEEVLSQIENAVIVTTRQGSLNVTQQTTVGTGFLVSAPYMEQTIELPNGATALGNLTTVLPTMYSNNRLFNMHHADVGPADVIVASRLIPSFDTVTLGSISSGKVLVSGRFTSCGSEIVDNAIMYYNNNGVINQQSVMSYRYVPMDAAHYSFVTREIGMLETFDWHPIVYNASLYLQSGSGTATIAATAFPMCDVDYYTFLSEQIISNLHATALLSEFTIPQIG